MHKFFRGEGGPKLCVITQTEFGWIYEKRRKLRKKVRKGQ